MSKVYLAQEIQTILNNIDYDKLGNNIAIKLHFGEKGCTTFMNPKLVKAVYDKILSLGKKATLIECNVLYRGSRTNSTDHLKTAKEHGFDFAPIDILDGENGEEYTEVKLDKGIATTVKIGKGLQKYDSMIVLTHFKGHGFAGYGGVFKNLGMGLGSRAGKLHMHSDLKPYVDKNNCTGCETCIKNCNFDAITLIDSKAEINHDKCVGCAMCIAVCPVGTVQVPWGSSSDTELQKKIVNYTDGVFKIIPKEKCIFINIMENITPECDCKGRSQKPMMQDVGILLSYDPVSIDRACLDLAEKYSDGKFDKINKVDKSIQVDYSHEKGLGEKEYEIIEL